MKSRLPMYRARSRWWTRFAWSPNVPTTRTGWPGWAEWRRSSSRRKTRSHFLAEHGLDEITIAAVNAEGLRVGVRSGRADRGAARYPGGGKDRRPDSRHQLPLPPSADRERQGRLPRGHGTDRSAVHPDPIHFDGYRRRLAGQQVSTPPIGGATFANPFASCRRRIPRSISAAACSSRSDLVRS